MLKEFGKGIAMGICDLVPGVSGGTMALLLGIYSRLLRAITNLNLRWVVPLVKYKEQHEEFHKHIDRMDLIFLSTVFLGIVTAIFIGAHFLDHYITQYPKLVMALFFGLIFAAAMLLTTHVKLKQDKRFGMGGFLIGASFAFVIPVSIPSTPLLTVLSGFVAILAMLLPGISGSYVLLIIGQYEHIIAAIKTIDWAIIGLFALGAILSFLTVSHGIHWLLSNHRHKTLVFLIGLVFGSLGVILKQLSFSLGVGIFALIGFVIPLAIHTLAKK